MKDKKLEANLSLVVSRIFAGLNMNALKFLLPVWMSALTGVTVRCTFAAIAFWVTGCTSEIDMALLQQIEKTDVVYHPF